MLYISAFFVFELRGKGCHVRHHLITFIPYGCWCKICFPFSRLQTPSLELSWEVFGTSKKNKKKNPQAFLAYFNVKHVVFKLCGISEQELTFCCTISTCHPCRYRGGSFPRGTSFYRSKLHAYIVRAIFIHKALFFLAF